VASAAVSAIFTSVALPHFPRFGGPGKKETIAPASGIPLQSATKNTYRDGLTPGATKIGGLEGVPRETIFPNLRSGGVFKSISKFGPKTKSR
jgi:hypothetical protein